MKFIEKGCDIRMNFMGFNSRLACSLYLLYHGPQNLSNYEGRELCGSQQIDQNSGPD